MVNEKRNNTYYIKVDNIEEMYRIFDRSKNKKIYFKFVCKSCGETQYINYVVRNRIKRFSNFLCAKCKRKLHDMNKYGVPLYTNREKAKQTSIKNIGVDNPFKLKRYRDKGVETRLKKYGSEWYMQSSEGKQKLSNIWRDRTHKEKQKIKNKIKSTLKERYGDENYRNIEKLKNTWNNKTKEEKQKIKDKQENTFLKKYNCKRPMQNELFKQRCISSNIKNHNGKLCSQTEEYKLKIIEKYGSMSPNILYNYYGTYFDSSWELAVWIYCIDNNIHIVRNPCRFEYKYNNEIHIYEPDFMINNQLVEIKGNHYFKEDGSMHFPYNRLHHNSELLTKEEKEYYNGLYESKHQCGIDNDVIFWKSAECKKYIDYCNIHYLGWKELYRKDNPYNPSYNIYYIPFTNNYIKDYYSYNSNKGIGPYDINKEDEYTIYGKGIFPYDIKR